MAIWSFLDPPLKKNVDLPKTFLWTLQKKKRKRKKKKIDKNYPFLSISVRFGIAATIRIGREIQCLPYAGFF